MESVEEMAEVMTRAYFGRETTKLEKDAIARFGMPKYGCGTLVAIEGTGDIVTDGHQFFVENMFWSDLLLSWVYYVPTFNFYQSESDLEEIK